MPTSRLVIDLSAVEHNLALLRTVISGGAAAPASAGAGVAAATGKVQLCAVIKQNAYGMGAGRIARKLAQCGADLLAVYSLDEARELVDLPIKAPILVLMPVSGIDRSDPLFRLTIAGRLHLVLHSVQHATELAAFCSRLGLQLPVHVQVDTGMSRGGCLPEEAVELVKLVASTPRFRLAGLMTHFSSPGHDEGFTREQAKLFRSLIDAVKPTLVELAKKGVPPVVVHAANTAATLRSGSLHATMVRVGQGLYGFGAGDLGGTTPADFASAASGLHHAVRWVAPLVHSEVIPAGWPVGYNRTFTSRRPARIGIVPVGYANGYPIGLGNRALVRLTGRAYPKVGDTSEGGKLPGGGAGINSPGQAPGVWAPVVGRVSMDQITIDLTDVPDAMCAIGMEVELIGSEPGSPNSVPRLAGEAGTIPHQLICGITASVERTYVVGQQGEGTVAGAGVNATAISLPGNRPGRTDSIKVEGPEGGKGRDAGAGLSETPLAIVSPKHAPRPSAAAG